MPTIADHLNAPRGYTTQTWLSTSIADRYFQSCYRLWFATELDPPRNGSSSNPRVLHEELQRIVYTNDFNHSRVEQLKRRLQQWIWGSSLSAAIKATVVAEIEHAPMRAFRPTIWSIRLDTIALPRLIDLGQFPDEYLIRDVVAPEFEVIVG